ncbi:DUF4123 domain-containing protein [Leptolyngbya sp. 7M]|uniref:DUF4123 domain-containing protein n=1 Tax=Leptolyngbya sp. 7M TaxID=2812896 RepID=UPI001B8AB82D|nr:DUF4123 domain-containing protein [Leptolyngbya sp. 7M]QYO65258.1 DUF4123 domain-containing protein [Leptolyngbya sp. 7M]
MDTEQIKKVIFDDFTRTFCVLDGVMVPELPTTLFKAQVPHHCLLSGELSPELANAAPYLAYLSPDSKFADRVLTESFGKHWGIILQTRRSMAEMRRHFQALLQAYDERGNPMKFRFYDPRVLSKFLPTCNGGELKTLFGDVDAFFTESSDGQGLIRYTIKDGKLEMKDLLKENR